MALESLITTVQPDRIAQRDPGQLAGLFRAMTKTGSGLIDLLKRQDRKMPGVEHFTFGEVDPVKAYTQNLDDAVGPFVDDAGTVIDPEFEAFYNRPDYTISTAHTHPSTDSSYSSADLANVNTFTYGRDKPGEHWIYKPRSGNWEGVRIRDLDLLTDPTEYAGLKFAPPTKFENLLSSDEYDYVIDDLYDEDLLLDLGIDPNVGYAMDRLSRKNLPLMMMGEEDKIDYFIPEDPEIDALFEAYKKLRSEM